MDLLDIDWDEEVCVFGRYFTKREFALISVALSLVCSVVAWFVLIPLLGFAAVWLGWSCVVVGLVLALCMPFGGFICGVPLVVAGTVLLLVFRG